MYLGVWVGVMTAWCMFVARGEHVQWLMTCMATFTKCCGFTPAPYEKAEACGCNMQAGGSSRQRIK